jgi:hypothetical protein
MAKQSGQGASARGRIAATISEISAEQRWFTFMRLAFGSTAAAWLLLFIWAIPGGPIVDMVPDYSAAAVLGLLFALGAIGGTLGFMFIWRPTFKGESLDDFAHVLLGGGLLLRRRAQFKARLAAECRRAKLDDASVFSLIVLKLSKSALASDQASNRRFGGKLSVLWARSVARADDIVGDAAADEIWILARGADELGCDIFTTRLAQQLSSGDVLPSFEGAMMGAVTFGEGGQAAKTLLKVASDRLVLPPEVTNRRAAA